MIDEYQKLSTRIFGPYTFGDLSLGIYAGDYAQGDFVYFDTAGLNVTDFKPKDFYVTFDNKGILFDPELTEKNQVETFTVSASSIDLVRFLLTGNDRHLRRVRLFGGEEWHDQFRLFMHSLTLPMLFADWKSWLSKQQSNNLPQRSLEPLLSKLELQRSEISQLELQVKEQRYDLQQLERKLKNTHRLYLLLIFIFAIGISAFNLL